LSAIGLGIYTYAPKKIFSWWKVGFVSIVLLLLLVRTIIATAFPYQQVETVLPLQGNDKVPLQLLYRNGDLQVMPSSDSDFHYTATELAGTHSFSHGVYKENKNNVDLSTESVLLEEARHVSLFSQWWSTGKVTFPATFSQPITVRYQDATGHVSFAHSAVTNLRVEVIESTVTVTVPNEKKEINLYLGGIDSRVYLNVPKSAEIRTTESFKSFTSAPSEFVKLGQQQWLRKGDGTGPIINLEVAVGRDSLLIKYIE
jgi:hypothetical protein